MIYSVGRKAETPSFKGELGEFMAILLDIT